MGAAKRNNYRKQGTALALSVLLLLCLCSGAAAEKVITLTFTGDCTLGSEEWAKKNPDSFDSVAAEKGYGYFFENFRDLFSRDDCTVVNCECVLSDSRDGENTSKSFRFRGSEEFAGIFKAGSVEAVSLANNHTLDYSERGLENTKRVLTEAGIGWACGECGKRAKSRQLSCWYTRERSTPGSITRARMNTPIISWQTPGWIW